MKLLLLSFGIVFLFGCQGKIRNVTGNLHGNSQSEPPRAERREFHHVLHGDKRFDPYHWLRNKDSKDVIRHLKQENLYFSTTMKKVKSIEDELFKEMTSRLIPNRKGPIQKLKEYFYWWEEREGEKYEIVFRRNIRSKDGFSVKILDFNKIAKSHKYFRIYKWMPSPNGKFIAYAIDTKGKGLYTIFVKDIESGQDLKIEIKNTSGNFVWSINSLDLFYVVKEPKSLRPSIVFQRRINNSTSTKIYEEKDNKFRVNVSRGKFEDYLFINSESKDTNEIILFPYKKRNAKPFVFSNRESNVKYKVYSNGKNFVILTNWKAKNYRIMAAKLPNTNKKHWSEVLPMSQKFIEALDVEQNGFAIQRLTSGLRNIKFYNYKGKQLFAFKPSDSVYQLKLNTQWESHENWIYYYYASPTKPSRFAKLNIINNNKRLLWKDQIKDYNEKLYKVRRAWARSDDGVKVPITYFYKSSTKLNDSTPILIDGYGAYGYIHFTSLRKHAISLLDRGFVYALPHVRGGGALGDSWYHSGRRGEKKNTFRDFVAVTKYFHRKNISSPQHTYAIGESAGGLIIGYIVNNNPELYKGVVSRVPFVDILSTMLDESLALTTEEYEEWGDPRKNIDYSYIKSYSPYDNIERRSYPAILALTGFEDTSVNYWEPAKWIARLRHNQKGDAPILLKTKFKEGHSSGSDRFSWYRKWATLYAFIIGVETNAITRQ